jgi:hypothetical protein
MPRRAKTPEAEVNISEPRRLRNSKSKPVGWVVYVLIVPMLTSESEQIPAATLKTTRAPPKGTEAPQCQKTTAKASIMNATPNPSLTNVAFVPSSLMPLGMRLRTLLHPKRVMEREKPNLLRSALLPPKHFRRMQLQRFVYQLTLHPE